MTPPLLFHHGSRTQGAYFQGSFQGSGGSVNTEEINKLSQQLKESSRGYHMPSTIKEGNITLHFDRVNISRNGNYNLTYDISDEIKEITRISFDRPLPITEALKTYQELLTDENSKHFGAFGEIEEQLDAYIAMAQNENQLKNLNVSGLQISDFDQLTLDISNKSYNLKMILEDEEDDLHFKARPHNPKVDAPITGHPEQRYIPKLEKYFQFYFQEKANPVKAEEFNTFLSSLDENIIRHPVRKEPHHVGKVNGQVVLLNPSWIR